MTDEIPNSLLFITQNKISIYTYMYTRENHHSAVRIQES